MKLYQTARKKRSSFRAVPIPFVLILLCLHLISSPMQAQVLRGKTGTIDAAPFELKYIQEGMGKAALVIGSSHYYYRAFSAELRKHLQLVFLDHRGFAPSPGPVDTTAFALNKIIEDMERTRQELDMGKIVVIGHSGHSYMALEYAKKYPEHVSHVVMIGIAPDLSAASWQAIEQVWEESVDSDRKRILAENIAQLPDEQLAKMTPSEAFIRSYVRDGPRAWFDPTFDSTPLWEDVEVNVPMFDYMWGRVFRDIDISKGLEDLKVPVFLALGRYDYLVGPPSTWNPFRAQFHDLTIRVFEQSGHTPPYEQAALFDRELLKWLDRN